VAIAIEKDYGNLPEIECYAGQLNQVFMNLLSNAVDALEEELERRPGFEPKILIRTQRVGEDRVCVAIADNGPGIPPAVQQRLFDPFFTTKPVGKGTGLGLAISYQVVVEKHGGDLRCLSAPGEGTTFEIEIPLVSGQTPESTQNSTPPVN
jgi:signal transduction histidine kinase